MNYKKIKTFEVACKALKLNPKKCLPDFSAYPKEHQAGMIAHAKLVIIAQALRGEWKPNWNDSNQYKYFPWFDMSGSGFSCDGFAHDRSRSALGSRLCYQSSEVARYAGKTFLKLYKEYFTI